MSRDAAYGDVARGRGSVGKLDRTAVGTVVHQIIVGVAGDASGPHNLAVAACAYGTLVGAFSDTSECRIRSTFGVGYYASHCGVGRYCAAALLHAAGVDTAADSGAPAVVSDYSAYSRNPGVDRVNQPVVGAVFHRRGQIEEAEDSSHEAAVGGGVVLASLPGYGRKVPDGTVVDAATEAPGAVPVAGNAAYTCH